MRIHTKNHLFAIAVIIGIGVIIFFIVWGILAYREERKKCTDNGGYWQKYNCRTITNVVYDYDMDGHLQGFHTETHERCDEKCTGARPEVAP